MNAQTRGVLALIKASRPSFRSLDDKVAFACHAVAAINGLKLLAVGARVDSQDALDPSAPEVDIEGWNQQDGEYAFLYACEAPEPAGSAGGGGRSLMLKCLSAEGAMYVTLMGGGPRGPQLPETLELDVARCAVPEAATAAEAGSLAPGTYGQLQELVAKVQEALDAQLDLQIGAASSSGNKGAAAAAAKAPAQAGGARSGGASSGRGDRDAGSLQEASVRPSRSPLLADDDDDPMPGMLPDPLMVGRPRYGGGMPLGPTGGGMHVGPGHPFFSDRLRHPAHGPGGVPGPGGLPGGLPSGARWDPIAPEGLQGWNPDDFQRGRPDPRQRGPPVHPDIMQPGPGRGTDWDHMFG